MRRAVGLPNGLVGEAGGFHVLPGLILLVRGVTVSGGRRNWVFQRDYEDSSPLLSGRWMIDDIKTYDFLCSPCRQTHIAFDL